MVAARLQLSGKGLTWLTIHVDLLEIYLHAHAIKQSPGCRTVGHCRTLSDTDDCRTTVRRLSDCRTVGAVGRLSDTVGHCRAMYDSLDAYAMSYTVGRCRTLSVGGRSGAALELMMADYMRMGRGIWCEGMSREARLRSIHERRHTYATSHHPYIAPTPDCQTRV